MEGDLLAEGLPFCMREEEGHCVLRIFQVFGSILSSSWLLSKWFRTIMVRTNIYSENVMEGLGLK